MGDPLVPEEITAIMGVEPTWSCRKGERSKRLWGPALFDTWSMKAADREPENFDEQIQEILGRLPSDLNIWADLGRKYTLNLFCGLFMRESNEGFLISPHTLNSLAQRGIEFDCDLYAP